MAVQVDRHEAYLAKAREELGRLSEAGVLSDGNAFSSILIVKAERGRVPLSGDDGVALRAAFGALGYAPEDWMALSTIDAAGNALDPMLLRQAVLTLDPGTVVVCDDEAATSVRDALSDELARLEDFDAAMLVPGVVTHVLGMRVLNLGGFEESLADPRAKQLMWYRLKQLRPLGEPY